MALWMGVYLFQLPLPITGISYFQWHAHEMIYGFSLAVIAGFLLTVVKNWTGVQSLHGFGLLTLFTLWALPRVLFLFGTRFMAGIWKKPLLWSLFIALFFIDLGFLLFAFSGFLNLSAMPVIHAFSYGGIGLMTLSMMARVSLGHTGRNVQEPPRMITLAFAALIKGG